MYEVLDKNVKRKKRKRIITDHMIGQKGAKFPRCVAVFFGEAE